MLPTRQIKTDVIFDFEVFPQWWVACFRRVDDPSVTWNISSDTYGYVAELRSMLAKHRLLGFNCKMYDFYIYNAILCDQKPEQVYQVSEDVIHDIKNKWTVNFAHYKWDWIDLFNDWRFGSLKMYEANKGLSITESSIPFGKTNLTDDDKAEIIRYCHADTEATYKLWLDRKDYFGIHEFVAKRYGISLTSACQKTMQSLTAAAMCATKPQDIFPEDKRKDIYVLDYIESTLGVNPFDYLLVNEKDERVFMCDGDKYVLGVGGIHSTLFDMSDEDESDRKKTTLTIAESNDKMQIWTMDFTQYYPNMLTKFKLMPRSVPAIGVERYKDMISKVRDLKILMNAETDRVIAGKLKDERDKYKVLINAVSGAMRSKYSKFFDPARIITMCAVGQFLIIAIAVDIKRRFPGTEILQTNTDGIYFYAPANADLNSAINEIAANIDFEIEVDKVDKLIQRNVNNYILLANGKVKTKGSWVFAKRPSFNPCKYAVCKIAVFNYLVYGTPIEDTIRADKDIMDFVTCVKTGGKTATGGFDETLYVQDGKDIPTSMSNRYIASKAVKSGILYKVKYNSDGTESRHLVPDCPPNALLLNDDISTYNIDELGIDYDFYIKKANDWVPTVWHILQ